jgi:transcription termination/antitermination protein NusG
MGKRPVPVEPDEIDSLRRALAAGIECQPHAGLQAGDEVEVISGPMRGTRGVLSRVRGQNRFLISVSLLNRSVSLEVDESQLIKRSVLSVRKTA